ncbi:MAG: DHHA1 domain-containing protein [Candidatus Diapherotrites archaeon]
MFYHSDTDGFCSAVIFSKTVEKLGAETIEAVAIESPDSLSKKICEKKLSNVVILDLSVDSELNLIKKLEKSSYVLILDHHKLYNDVNSKKTILVKPQFLSSIEPSSYPASKLCFDLCSCVVNIDSFAWIAAVGIIGDFSYNQWKTFVDKAAKRAEVSVDELKIISEIINAVQVVSPDAFPKLFELFKISVPKDVLNSEFDALRKKAIKELEFWKNKFYKNAEYYEDIELYYLKIRPKYRIKSMLIDSLTKEFPNKTIIIAEDLGDDFIRVSARRQDFKIQMNSLLENAISGIKGATAGGHVPAAAAKIPRAKFGEFKKNILKILRNKQ